MAFGVRGGGAAMNISEPTGSQAAAVERRRRIVEAIARDGEMTVEQIRER